MRIFAIRRKSSGRALLVALEMNVCMLQVAELATPVSCEGRDLRVDGVDPPRHSPGDKLRLGPTSDVRNRLG